MEKVAFIICYNNELYMRECLEYISWLNVPEGVETEVIGIAEAESMAAGYNAAMHESDAKYKVYLHQDLYILNENFIKNVIDLFAKYPEYGMLGVVGSKYIVNDANYWMAWNVGKCDANNGLAEIHNELENSTGISNVRAVDGMIMITQYDIEWREDVFDGFDYYDISQSEEFRRHGYRVGVPYQKESWCNHVCGSSKLKKYDLYRRKFCTEYQKEGYCYKQDDEIDEIRNGHLKIEVKLPALEELYNHKEFAKLNKALLEATEVFQHNTTLCELQVINQMLQMEISDHVQNGFYEERLSWAETLEKYHAFRFLLFRLEYKKKIEGMEAVLKQIMACDLRSVIQIAEYTVFDVNRVVKRIVELSL